MSVEGILALCNPLKQKKLTAMLEARALHCVAISAGRMSRGLRGIFICYVPENLIQLYCLLVRLCPSAVVVSLNHVVN